MKLFSQEHKEWARNNYLDMKHRAGVEPGMEFIKIVNGKLMPCSEQEYDKLTENKAKGKPGFF